ncbi:MAG: hypothetical protein MZV70_41005 [Desulfobacterales bacterium]|nr:hypothetical protein [Desulfobacterales bacterium]
MSLLKKLNWKVLALLVVLGGAVGGFRRLRPAPAHGQDRKPRCSATPATSWNPSSRPGSTSAPTARSAASTATCRMKTCRPTTSGRSIDGMKDVVVFYSGQTPENDHDLRTREEVRAGQLHPLPHRARGDDQPGSQLLGLPSLPSAPPGRRPHDELKPIDRLSPKIH